MEWMELIQLRPYAEWDKHKAVRAFRQLSLSKTDDGLKSICLFNGLAIDHELSIRLHWRGRIPSRGKSRLGLQLAESFSEFGQVYHSGWIKLDELHKGQGRKTNAN